MKLVTGLPDWFPLVFAHLAPTELAVVSRLWTAEPALRTLALMLDELHPKHCKRRGCPRCGHVSPTWRSEAGGKPRAKCPACRTSPVITIGTPFYRIHQKNWPALYGTMFVQWGPWTPVQAWKIAGCTDAKQLVDFRRRLLPLFEQLPDGTALTSHAAYRLGFTPAEQGVTCLRCNSDEVTYRKRSDSANPTFECLACRYHFQLHASRRHLLPLDASVNCPNCAGRQLNRSYIDARGRQHYRCRDCGRNFIELRKPPAAFERQQRPTDPR